MKNKFRNFIILTFTILSNGIIFNSCSIFCDSNSKCCKNKGEIVKIDTTSTNVKEAARNIQDCLDEMSPDELFPEDYVQGCCKGEDNNLENDAQRRGIRIIVPKCRKVIPQAKGQAY